MFGKPRNGRLLAGALILAFSTLVLGGCNGDSPEAGRPTEKQATLLEDRFLEFDDIIVTTNASEVLVPAPAEEQERKYVPRKQEARTLRVSAYAYCETMGQMEPAEYKTACRKHVVDALEYLAKDRNKFEGSIPAVSSSVRNHKDLPSIFGTYPEEYASFPKDVMRNMLEMSPKDDLYTVTAIEDVTAQ